MISIIIYKKLIVNFNSIDITLFLIVIRCHIRINYEIILLLS